MERYQDHWRLPAKGSAYSLPELLVQARPILQAASREGGASYIEHQYRTSHRMALALERLQGEVGEAVRSANYRPKELFPQNDREYFTTIGNAGLSKEIRFDPTQEAKRLHDGKPSWRLREIREAQRDPLAMARKHVVDLLAPNPGSRPLVMRAARAAYDVLRIDDSMTRDAAAGEVQNLMMLMADNEVNHKVQQRTLS